MIGLAKILFSYNCSGGSSEHGFDGLQRVSHLQPYKACLQVLFRPTCSVGQRNPQSSTVFVIIRKVYSDFLLINQRNFLQIGFQRSYKRWKKEKPRRTGRLINF
eukprot:TRINITY_DN2935_c0_g1_i3.p1 TRINITY_DN2935_c0_g1~~TRINITY_DN2935_c0_g1_i3.p1  ORF type:complete len:104 (+),score=10.74 TRINITY_DN2935_c0_g1_i3:1874-2185(+)